MIKRVNKITALLVAAASIMSVVPAMAATKLETKDGTIENAVAFKDGKYLYQGYRTDDDDSGLYYNAGDKDKKLDDASQIDTAYGKYDSKYVAAIDGNDNYIVDLSTGKISDDDTAADLEDTASTKLNTKLKKTDRYGNANIESMDLRKIKQNRFGDIWYEYTATTAAGVSTSAISTKTTTAAGVSTTITTAGAATVYTGYTNSSGSYIDCSKDANIYAFNGKKMVKLETLGDKDTTYGTLTLTSIEFVKTLAQDDKYIYRLVKVHVDGAKAVGAPTTANEDSYYVQKISKAQGDKEKDAYLPKTTDSYQLGLEATMGDGDVSDAYKAIIEDSDSNYSKNDAIYYVVDGALYTTFRTGEKVKTIKMNLKTSQKLKLNNKSSDSKIDGHVVVKDTDQDTKIEDKGTNNGTVESFSVDVDGNVWALRDGEISKSTKCGDFKVVYTVDRSFNALDVYDDKDIIAWEDGGDAYTTVNEGTKQATDEVVTPTKVGWDQLSDGSWNFYDAAGTKVANNWANAGGTWYYLNADGTMATGWQQVNGSWYYLNPISDGTRGAMKTGWVNNNGTWYYCNGSGAMATGWQQVNGSWYYLNPISDGTRGAMKTGWINDNGTWYYCNGSGAMLANTTVNGYRLASSGALI